MCRRIDCAKCGKPTYAGCGRHVEQVLGEVPPKDRCRCAEAKRAGEEAQTAKEPPRSKWWPF